MHTPTTSRCSRTLSTLNCLCPTSTLRRKACSASPPGSLHFLVRNSTRNVCVRDVASVSPSSATAFGAVTYADFIWACGFPCCSCTPCSGSLQYQHYHVTRSTCRTNHRAPVQWSNRTCTLRLSSIHVPVNRRYNVTLLYSTDFPQTARHHRRRDPHNPRYPR